MQIAAAAQADRGDQPLPGKILGYRLRPFILRTCRIILQGSNPTTSAKSSSSTTSTRVRLLWHDTFEAVSSSDESYVIFRTGQPLREIPAPRSVGLLVLRTAALLARRRPA